MVQTSATMSRRSFVKAAGVAGAVVAAGAATTGAVALGHEGAMAEAPADERIVWTHCHVNCGGACVLQMHMKGDEIDYVESDNTGDGSFGGFQARACLRGRSIKAWLEGEDRLNYPMRRVAGTKRGDGQYERISWDEALDTIASEFTRIRDTYGNEAIFIQECSGVEQNIMMNNPFFRLFNLLGGEITRYGSYSSAAISFGANPYTYGGGWGKHPLKSVKPNSLVVLFGMAPNDTHMAGDGAGYDLNVVREQKNVRVIVIDYRRSELATNQDVEWIPIVPGTDAALVAGIAHELITKNLVDREFLDTYCVGFDEATLPEGAPANSSYEAYVMGTGYDMVEKTPAWASAITRIPEQRIIDLAHEIAEAKPCYIAQGLGPQRHTNGDYAARAIMALPQMVGQVGKPGTNSGGRVGNGGFGLSSLPTGDNPVKTKIPQYLWPEAIANWDQMTAENAGVRGADKLSTGIKMLVNYGNNMMANQNGDINYTTDILRDESLCEFIVQYDVNWTPSCNWADIVLPDLTPQETWTLSAAGENNDAKGLWLGQPIYEPKYERREVYEVCGELAKRLGVYDEYSEGGLTRKDWCEKLYNELREEEPQLPTFEEMLVQGIYKEPIDVEDVTEDFILDPEANPLGTATGKIQFYSPELAELAKTWQLPDGDVLYPIPVYFPGHDGADSTTEENPLIISAFHTKATTHSSYANNEAIREVAKFQAWINPIDAQAYGIEDNCLMKISTDQGEMVMRAKVTNRIMPGVVTVPQGSWYKGASEGDNAQRIDEGGCINTLCSRHPNVISKGTGQHSCVGRVEKVEG